jgi:methanogenic corrinoid protein MtbC1
MTPPEFPEIELALISKAMAGDAGGLYRIASDLMEGGVPFDAVLFDYLLAAERSVGQRWAQGDYLVAEEHAVTAAIETVISLLAGLFDQPQDAPSVMVATAEGDDHSLPARAAAAHLLFLGYKTTFLGGSIPADDLHDFLEAEPPSALMLSGAMTTHLLGARSIIAAAHEAGVPVVAGGKAFGRDGRWASAVGVDRWVATLREAADVVEQWARGEGPGALADQAPIPDSLRDLMSARSRVLGRAREQLGSESVRLQDEAELLLGAIESALLTGDNEIVSEMLHWQSKSLTAYGLDPDLVVDAVADQLSEFEDAATLLAGARSAGDS